MWTAYFHVLYMSTKPAYSLSKNAKGETPATSSSDEWKQVTRVMRPNPYQNSCSSCSVRSQTELKYPGSLHPHPILDNDSLKSYHACYYMV